MKNIFWVYAIGIVVTMSICAPAYAVSYTYYNRSTAPARWKVAHPLCNKEEMVLLPGERKVYNKGSCDISWMEVWTEPTAKNSALSARSNKYISAAEGDATFVLDDETDKLNIRQEITVKDGRQSYKRYEKLT